MLLQPSSLMQEVPPQIFNLEVSLFSLKYFVSKPCTFSSMGCFYCQMKCQCPRQAFQCCVQEHHCKTFSQRYVNRIRFWDESGPLYHAFHITMHEISCWQVSFIRNLSGFWKKWRGVRAVAFCAIQCDLIL